MRNGNKIISLKTSRDSLVQIILKWFRQKYYLRIGSCGGGVLVNTIPTALPWFQMLNKTRMKFAV
jgi:hypothetical protein